MIDNNDIIYLKQCLLKMSIPSGLEIGKNKIRNPNKWLTNKELEFIKEKIYWGRSLYELMVNTHFNKNSKEDIDRLNKLKLKYKNYYENKGKWPPIITVWTESDVLKRNKAKKEKLKYIEIFTIKEEEIIQILKDEEILE